MVTPAMGATMEARCIPYGKTGLNMAAIGASLHSGALA